MVALLTGNRRCKKGDHKGRPYGVGFQVQLDVAITLHGWTQARTSQPWTPLQETSHPRR